MFAQRQEEFSPFRSLVLKDSDSSSNVVIINKGFLGSCYAIAYTHTHLMAENHWFERGQEVGCPDGRVWASNAFISTTEKQSAQNLSSTHKSKLNYKSLQNTFDTNSCATEKLEPPRTSLPHEKIVGHLEIDLTIFFFGVFIVPLSFLFQPSSRPSGFGLHELRAYHWKTSKILFTFTRRQSL